MDNPERHVTLEARHLTETNNTKYTTQKFKTDEQHAPQQIIIMNCINKSF